MKAKRPVTRLITTRKSIVGKPWISHSVTPVNRNEGKSFLTEETGEFFIMTERSSQSAEGHAAALSVIGQMKERAKREQSH